MTDLDQGLATRKTKAEAKALRAARVESLGLRIVYAGRKNGPSRQRLKVAQVESHTGHGLTLKLGLAAGRLRPVVYERRFAHRMARQVDFRAAISRWCDIPLDLASQIKRAQKGRQVVSDIEHIFIRDSGTRAAGDV